MLPTNNLHTFNSMVPLNYDTIYYVESLDNETLNDTMRRLAQQPQPLFEDTEMQPFPFLLKYLARTELMMNPQMFNDEMTAEYISELCHHLTTGPGGTLAARYLPIFSSNDTFEDDHLIISLQDFSTTIPEHAENTARVFAMDVAKTNFYRLANATYDDYLESMRPSRPYSGFGQEVFGMITRKKTKVEIDANHQRHIDQLSDWLNQNNFSVEEQVIFLDELSKRLKNQSKIKEVYPLQVYNENIYIVLSSREEVKIHFRKARKAKVLYIFYLRHAKLSVGKTSYPKHVSFVDLEKYKDELVNIYVNLGEDIKSAKTKIDHLCESSAVFYDIQSSINTSIREIIDEEANGTENYLIKIVDGESDSRGNSVYGVNLDPDLINLGRMFDF
jgi:hypothetical protein